MIKLVYIYAVNCSCPTLRYSNCAEENIRGVFWILSNICDALRDLVLFVQFKKREKHPWMSVTFSKVAGF